MTDTVVVGVQLGLLVLALVWIVKSIPFRWVAFVV
jgi:hypothetical protein